jgi:hypothetical protein
MEKNIIKEQIANAVGGGGIAAIGVNQDGTPYNAGGDPINKFGEPPVFSRTKLLKRKKKKLKDILASKYGVK